MMEVNTVRLFLPQSELQRRVGPDPTPLQQYIQRLLIEADAFWQAQPSAPAGGVLVAMGVGPGRESRSWCQAVSCEMPDPMLRALEEQLDSISPLIVQHGPIALAIELRLNGAQGFEFPPIPQTWIDSATQTGREVTMPDGLFQLIWPEGMGEGTE